MQNPEKGNIFIISAASGTGKTTLVSRLLQNHNTLRVSVSHTTRAPRTGEENGVHYHFVSKEEFERLIAANAFLEHADVFGNYYGTGIESVQSLCAQGFDVILEIDVQGAEQVRRKLPEACSIFILPPSAETLAQRLKGRATDSEDVIQTRLAKARHEISRSVDFDYVVINDQLDTAEAELYAVIRSRRLKTAAQSAFIENLLDNF
ncbi:guanylate kinase [Neisseria sp. ZJ106]|uniref:Guanylate kinase n=1 Tax=Neisseria lisongii TaxID=2912188 RepID=A0ABY7RH36_9NEIS|nr:guanylate kinase [Neisseria lisongii]MCF7521611.1 guanylate kinase [Neisseria lisongii]WCL70847.1 guanylate kinase [Neisseria lisongii]